MEIWGIAQVYEGDRFTYGEAQEISVSLSRALAQEFGVKRGADVGPHACKEEITPKSYVLKPLKL